MPKQAEPVIDLPPEGESAEEAGGTIFDLLSEFDPGDGTLASDVREDDEEGDVSPPSEDEDQDEEEQDVVEEDDVDDSEELEDVEDEDVDEELYDDDEAEDEEASDDTYTITVDGEETEVTLDELRNGYQRQAAFTKKTQALAEKRKATEALQEQLSETRTKYLNELSVAEQFVIQLAGEPPSDELLDKNPTEYTRQKARYDKALQSVQQLRAKQNELVQEALQEAQEQRAQRQQEEYEKLLELIPEWKDPEVAKKESVALVEFAEKRAGITAQEIADIDDSRFFFLLHLASIGARAQGEVTDPSKKGRKGRRKPLKPGTRKSSKSSARVASKKKQKQILDRLKKTGSKDDAAEAIFGLDFD